MDKKYILKTLRPLRIKMYIHRYVKILLYALAVSGFISLILSVASMFAVVPFVRYKMFIVTGAGVLIAFLVSLFFLPSTRQVILTADSLGLKERVITAWCLIGDDSEIARLQRQDTKKTLEGTNLASLYKFRIDKGMYILPACIIAVSFLLTFIPGRTYTETKTRESLINQMNQTQKEIEGEIEKEKKQNPEISEEQIKQLEEALERLKEEFRKAESEEDALKALTQMKNQLEKLKEQNPLRDLKTIEDRMAGSELTENIAEALKNRNDEELKKAFEELQKVLENNEKMKELAEILKKAAMDIRDGSWVSESLQNIAENAISGNLNSNELSESLAGLLQQIEENAAGQHDFENALGNISKIVSESRKAVSSVDHRLASAGDNTHIPGQNEYNADGSGNPQGRNNDESRGGGAATGQAGNMNGTGEGNTGESKNNSGTKRYSNSESSGAGSGTGTSDKDSDYSDGEQGSSGRTPGSGKEEEYDMIYAPERLEGSGNESTIPGRKLDSGSSTYTETSGAVRKGKMVPYREVLSEYREEAVQTMDRLDIPAGMKELVKSYFSSLE